MFGATRGRGGHHTEWPRTFKYPRCVRRTTWRGIYGCERDHLLAKQHWRRRRDVSVAEKCAGAHWPRMNKRGPLRWLLGGSARGFFSGPKNTKLSLAQQNQEPLGGSHGGSRICRPDWKRSTVNKQRSSSQAWRPNHPQTEWTMVSESLGVPKPSCTGCGRMVMCLATVPARMGP